MTYWSLGCCERNDAILVLLHHNHLKIGEFKSSGIRTHHSGRSVLLHKR